MKNQPALELLPLLSLQNTLDLLLEQAQAYEHALPPGNYPARAAVSALARLAQQAQNEARSLAETLQPQQPAELPCSPRETEVLTLTAEGLTNKEIAYRLGISERTVQFHLNSIFNKTGAQSRTEAVALALKNGWLGVTANRSWAWQSTSKQEIAHLHCAQAQVSSRENVPLSDTNPPVVMADVRPVDFR